VQAPEVPAPRWAPPPAALDDVECRLLGAYGPGRSVGGPAGDETAGAPGPSGWSPDLRVPRGVAETAVAAGLLELLDEEGTPVAAVRRPSAVGDVDALDEVGLAGELEPRQPFARSAGGELHRPAPGPAGAGSAPVLAVPVRAPASRPRLEAVRRAAGRTGAEVLLLPLTGAAHRAVDAGALVRTWLRAAEELGGARVVPVPAPDHGDGVPGVELLVARSYGATHVLLPGASAPARSVGAPEPVAAPLLAPEDGRWVPDEGGQPADAWEDEAADDPGSPVWTAAAQRELRRGRGPGGSPGVVVLLTGYSGSGKSTVARALVSALLERTDRSLTLLDGDRVRRLLSAGLGFSREDRVLNVRRVGWVAAQVAAHGGVAVCAPIAPYAQTRAEVRAMAEEHGRFLLVHVSTPLEVCEARDRKGLYARARAGLLPAFTGVSDPYEVPEDAELVVDTSSTSVEGSVDAIMAALSTRGWVRREERA